MVYFFRLLFFFQIVFPAIAPAQEPQNRRYGVETLSDTATYRTLVSRDSNQRLVPLDRFIPGIQLDIRYATAENFMRRRMYNLPAAFLRLPAADSLKVIQNELNLLGLGLKIFDAYRPYQVTVAFYEKVADTTFVASPYRGSRHNRGCAIDVTLIDMKTGKELDMPTEFDDFSEKAHSNYPNLSKPVIRNRELLKAVMTRHGFEVYAAEWWHFDFAGWQQFPVTDIPFETLRKL